MADKRTNFEVVLRRPTRVRKSIAKLYGSDDGWLDRGTKLTVSKVFSGPSYHDSLGWVSNQWLHVKDVGYLWAGGCADSVFWNEDNPCEVMKHNFSGRGVRVAIIDEAFDLSKTKVKVKKKNLFCAAKEIVDTDDLGEASSKMNIKNRGVHGTQCAELIHHIAPNAELFLCAISPDTDQKAFVKKARNLVSALNWIKNEDRKIDIISVSLAETYYSKNDVDVEGVLDELSDLLNELDGSTLFISSVGNSADHGEGDSWPSFYGGGSANCIVIGAYRKHNYVRYLSNSINVNIIDYLAPGADFSSWTSYHKVRFGDTSAACAYTAGVLAMFKDEDNWFSITNKNEINELLVSEGDSLTNDKPFIDLSKWGGVVS